jgi:hypothetical protein
MHRVRLQPRAPTTDRAQLHSSFAPVILSLPVAGSMLRGKRRPIARISTALARSSHLARNINSTGPLRFEPDLDELANGFADRTLGCSGIFDDLVFGFRIAARVQHPRARFVLRAPQARPAAFAFRRHGAHHSKFATSISCPTLTLALPTFSSFDQRCILAMTQASTGVRAFAEAKNKMRVGEAALKRRGR